MLCRLNHAACYCWQGQHSIQHRLAHRPTSTLPRSFFDFDKLAEVTSVVTRNLNKIIDVNYYPVETARRSNMRHRPIGLGVQVQRCWPELAGISRAVQSGWRIYPVTTRHSVMAQCNGRHAPWWLKQPLPCCSLRLQGLADTFLLLGLPFDSPEASELNKQIFETIYFAALRTSMQLAKAEGGLLGRQPTAHPPRLPWLAALPAAGLHQPRCWEYMVVSGRQC